MARAKKASKKPAAKKPASKKPAATKAKAKAIKARAKTVPAKPKAEAKAKTKAKAKARATAKPAPKKARPAARKGTREPTMEPREAEVDPIDEILEVLACPPSTADQMSEVCEEGLEAIQDNLPHVAAAELVWRERPEHTELSTAITSLIEELQRHAQVLASLYERLHTIALDVGEHEDLDLAEVLDRIRPLLEQHADDDHDHGDGHAHDHDHGDGQDHGHVHDDN